MPTATLNSIPCPVCKFPILIREDTHGGQQIKCPSCNSISEAITQVTIPTSVLIGVLCFGAGVVLGPAFLVSTQFGQEWLGRKARERLGK